MGPGHNDASVRLAQAQKVMDETFCSGWAKTLVTAKLQRQRDFLTFAQSRRPAARKALFDAHATIDNAIEKLRSPELIACET